MSMYSNSLAQVRFLLGTAIVDEYKAPLMYEIRKNQYLESFSILKNLGFSEFYIVEACKKVGPTFLEDYSRNVFYASCNDTSLKNNGVNESKTLLEGMYHFQFDPEDMIIKFVARHHFLSDYFFKIVMNNLEYDAFVKDAHDGHNIHTLCYAMRCKYFVEMFENIDYEAMERQKINIEHELFKYINRKVKEGNFKVFYVDRLDFKASYLGSCSQPGIQAQITIH